MANFELKIGNKSEKFNSVDEFKGGLKALLKTEESFSIAVAKKEEDCLKEIAKILNEKGMKMKLDESDPLAVKFFFDIMKDAYKFGLFGAAAAEFISLFFQAGAAGVTAAAETEATAGASDFLVPGSAEFLALAAGIGVVAGTAIGIGKKVIKLKIKFKVLDSGEEGVAMDFCFA